LFETDPTITAYPVHSTNPFDSGTDSDTSSDDGLEELPNPGISQMTGSQAAEHIYLEYRAAKKTWRRFTGKPVRHFRRNVKRIKGSGKSKGGKGKGFGFYWTHDDTLAYLKGKGKGNRAHTSGKGFGRRTNPKDREGNTMKCRVCNSEEHFCSKLSSIQRPRKREILFILRNQSYLPGLDNSATTGVCHS